jgi:Protein of unknown function (DUF3991)
VFGLSEYLGSLGFVEALDHVRDLVGFVPCQPVWKKPFRDKAVSSVKTRWNARPRIKPNSSTWRYLNEVRCIPSDVLHLANAQDCIREGPYGSLWAAHKDHTGLVTGWEERGPQWRGFASGGSKRLLRRRFMSAPAAAGRQTPILCFAAMPKHLAFILLLRPTGTGRVRSMPGGCVLSPKRLDAGFRV